MKKRGLGKGLEALFTDETFEDDSYEIRITLIEPNPNQPRKSFDAEQLNALAESIKQHGVLQPIVVTKRGDGTYTIVAGERRWRAARIAGLKTIPAIVKDISEVETYELALVENLQREDLNPVEEARGYKSLMEMFSLTQEEISARVGKSRSAVANSLRLLNLPEKICEMLASGDLSEGHARALLSISNADEQLKLAERIVAEGLSVREAEAEAKKINSPPQKAARVSARGYNNFVELENRLSEVLSTKVRIVGGSKKGRIEIEFYDDEQLGWLLSQITRG